MEEFYMNKEEKITIVIEANKKSILSYYKDYMDEEYKKTGELL